MVTRTILILALAALTAGPARAKRATPVVAAKPPATPAVKAPPKPERVAEEDYQHMQAAIWRDQAAQLELEAAQRRALAAQSGAAEARAALDSWRTAMNTKYELTPTDHVGDGPGHAIARGK